MLCIINTKVVIPLKNWINFIFNHSLEPKCIGLFNLWWTVSLFWWRGRSSTMFCAFVMTWNSFCLLIFNGNLHFKNCNINLRYDAWIQSILYECLIGCGIPMPGPTSPSPFSWQQGRTYPPKREEHLTIQSHAYVTWPWSKSDVGT